MRNYRSSIPRNARERVVATHLTGPQKYKAEYWLNGKLVGVRHFFPNEELSQECPLKNGRQHGTVYFCDDAPARVCSSEPWINGLPHGVARQYSDDETILGTYTMKHGTGLDLWWQGRRWGAGPPYLSEARYLKDGKWDGFEWWLDEDQRYVWQERHFLEDELHGIERHWNAERCLRRGYPRYWIKGRRVTRRQYVAACKSDPTLPPFHEADNKPLRKFPPEVRQHLRSAR
jgi:hypothetical protein